jgi:AraC family transcriptional activator of pobA
VDVSRLAVDVADDLRLNDEPLLSEVFGFIEKRYSERVSLRDVARAVSLSRGHLTTVVRRKTGGRCRSGFPSAAWWKRVVSWSRLTWQ